MARPCPWALRLLVLLASSALAPACRPDAAGFADAPPPHVVLIVADDQGWSDVGYHDEAIATPHIDRLAREGLRLERFYVSPICSPSRAALLTGRYPIRYGLSRAVIAPWRDFGLDPAEVTLPQHLEEAGYRHRGLFGKWHLGHLRRRWHPLARGFSEFRGYYNGAIDPFEHTREGERDWHEGYEPLVEEGYSTDLIAAATVRFIERHAADGPLLVVASFGAPHPPFAAPEEYLARYEHLGDADGVPGLRRVRAAMITCMDDGIGRILDALERTGIAGDTLVWFLSDNGATVADALSNRPLRGGKHDLFEGGIRVPSCVRWPRGLPAGQTLEGPAAIQDVLPTVMQAAGLADHGGPALDGIGLLEALRGEPSALEPLRARRMCFYVGQEGEQSEKLAVIDWPHKLIVLGPSLAEGPPDGRHQRLLFDLEADPGERVDLSAERPGLVEELDAALVEFRRLQPRGAVAPYEQGREGFVVPPDWSLAGPR